MTRRLVIVLEPDADLSAEDPHDVAEELLHTDGHGWGVTNDIRPYADVPIRFVSAEWSDG